MGYGDAIMMLGEAEKLHKQTGKKIYIPADKLHNKDSMYYNVDFLTSDKKDDAIKLDLNYKNLYMVKWTSTRNFFKPYKPLPFALRPTEEEKALFKDLPDNFVAINPDTKTGAYPGKNWGPRKWIELCERLSEHLTLVRFHTRPFKGLKGVIHKPVKNAREAFIGAGKASLAVSYEGGYVHATTGFGVRTIVIWGGMATPDIVGYEKNRNIVIDDPRSPCGSKKHCQHCIQINEQITVDMVYDIIMEEAREKGL